MKEERVIEIEGNTEVSEGVDKRISHVGIRGLNIDKVKELGVYDRMSTLLTAYHVSIVAAYRIYGNVLSLMDAFGGRKRDIAKACNDYERAYEKFLSFWSEYYASEAGNKDANRESEKLYHNIMEWAQLPELWLLGEPVRLDTPTDTVIRIDNDDENNVLSLYKCVLNEEILESDESWCISKYEPEKKEQQTIEQNMDKASALMVAKRLSDGDSESVYIVNQVMDLKKTETVVIPFRAFKDNKTVGRADRVLKKQ